MQLNSDVYLLKQETYNLQQLTKNFKDLITQNKLNVENKIIVINADFNFPLNSNSLSSTHPIFLGALARALKFLGAYKVKILGNFPLLPARVGFLALGTSAYTMGYAEEIYLDETTYTNIHNNDSITKQEFNIPKILLDADLFFSVTKLRTDLFFKINSSVVNSIKLLPYNEHDLILKENTYQKLFDLFCIRMPDFCIVDGIQSAEGQSPLQPDLKDTKIIIAGRNALDVDFVCQQLVGINQDEIAYLKIFKDKLNQSPALEKINIINKDLLFNYKFLLPKNIMQNIDKCCEKSLFKLNLSSLLFGYLGYFQNKLKLKKYPPYQKKEILPLLSAIKTYCHK